MDESTVVRKTEKSCKICWKITSYGNNSTQNRCASSVARVRCERSEEIREIECEILRLKSRHPSRRRGKFSLAGWCNTPPLLVKVALVVRPPTEGGRRRRGKWFESSFIWRVAADLARLKNNSVSVSVGSGKIWWKTVFWSFRRECRRRWKIFSGEKFFFSKFEEEVL